MKVENIQIGDDYLTRSAKLIQKQLGEEGIRKVGGTKWWQWRKDAPLDAEWIEMRSDYNERKQSNGQCQRVMFYVHGGAYYFGSVDEHRYQLQRHARKLKARVLSPEYRLAPQFPFPCGLQDCLAAYLFLLETQDPKTIVFAGDSAGGGMILSILVLLRDQGLPLPTGAILISPWVDLTHSFPSLCAPCPFDYIPRSGFHHKPSKAWPPPNEEEFLEIQQIAQKIPNKKIKDPKANDGMTNIASQGELKCADSSTRYVRVFLEGEKETVLKDQLQMYTTNDLLNYPMVSPIMYSTLGGLPPLLVMVGGGEILRDEQIYLAHKCANPTKYTLKNLSNEEREKVEKYPPTNVQLQVWEDLCHVAPTLSFTRPAKFMYRSVAQFGAWALARAQKIEIEMVNDDKISVISTSVGDSEDQAPALKEMPTSANLTNNTLEQIGKAGDPLPPFKNHIIRQRVSRHGIIFPLEPEEELEALQIGPEDIGVIKAGPVKNWLSARQLHDKKFASTRAKIHKKRLRAAEGGFETFGACENPPPCALAGRRPKIGETSEWGWTKQKSWGLALWSGWASKHDEATVEREHKAEHVQNNISPSQAKTGEITIGSDVRALSAQTSSSHTRVVVDSCQTEESQSEIVVTPIIEVSKEKTQEKNSLVDTSSSEIDLGASGKRPHLDGIAMPFTVNKEPETASMITLYSHPGSGGGHSRAPSNASSHRRTQSSEVELGVSGRRPKLDGIAMPFSLKHKDADDASMITLESLAPSIASPTSTQIASSTGRGARSTNMSLGSPLAREVTTTDFFGDEPEKVTEGKQDASKLRANQDQAKLEMSNEFESVINYDSSNEANIKKTENGHALKRPKMETFVTAREELPVVLSFQSKESVG